MDEQDIVNIIGFELNEYDDIEIISYDNYDPIVEVTTTEGKKFRVIVKRIIDEE